MSEGIQLKIQQLPNSQIKGLLVEHFVENANKPTELFIKQSANDRPIIPTENDIEQKIL